ncbi:hypothetical protein PVK06_021210 [Gossypium arboreum]|uniref:Uncharacterized protein n=1 Tax=Gossypium arboreum TaxID=29729 RepID=A0ABR0PPE4_GOSAR|nr:hypothetical protein PVK06_021210 [Gossypium arboreum]
MKVLSIKYRFCTSVDPVRYDSFDIKGPRSLEAMVQTHLASRSPYLELYVQFSSSNDTFATSTSNVVREEYTTPARHSGCYETSIRRDYVLPTTSTGEGTSFVADDGGSDDESNMDPPRESDPDGAEFGLFSEPKPVLTIPEDVE